jgi:hypothetical protein
LHHNPNTNSVVSLWTDSDLYGRVSARNKFGGGQKKNFRKFFFKGVQGCFDDKTEPQPGFHTACTVGDGGFIPGMNLTRGDIPPINVSFLGNFFSGFEITKCKFNNKMQSKHFKIPMNQPTRGLLRA